MNSPALAPIAGIVGHFVDLTNLARFTFANPHSYTKYRHILAVAGRTNATTLIETGTYKGVTTRRCISKFKRIITVELDPTLATDAARRLSRFKNCEVVTGDANEEVPLLLERADIGEHLMFFLDGHFSGGCTASGAEAEPALRVLSTIALQHHRVAGIIVDDFREFGTQPGWPSKGELVATAEQLFCPLGFKLSVHLDQLVLERSCPGK